MPRPLSDISQTHLDRHNETSLTNGSLDELSLSYNGGKDCLVLLILYLVSLHTHFQRLTSTDIASSAGTRPAAPSYLESVYIQHPNSFFEVDEFVRTSARQYHLAVASSTLSMKEAFAEYLRSRPKIKAIFVGTRRNDPYAAYLKHFDPTDHGWPDFMRVHPVIDWHYREVWAVCRETKSTCADGLGLIRYRSS